jgi:hypothetical protein
VSKTVTNQKTTFDADTNSDISVRSITKGSDETQVVTLDLGGAGAESLVAGYLPTLENRPASAAVTSVAGSATSVTILASNANRRGATIHNDSSAILYVKFGAAATTSSFTAKLIADAYYEVPFSYTGIIDGIWASATGNARITEVS